VSCICRGGFRKVYISVIWLERFHSLEDAPITPLWMNAYPFQSSLKYYITAQLSSLATHTQLQICCVYESVWRYYYESEVSGNCMMDAGDCTSQISILMHKLAIDSWSWWGHVQKSLHKMRTPIFHINFEGEVHMLCGQMRYFITAVFIKMTFHCIHLRNLGLHRVCYMSPKSPSLSHTGAHCHLCQTSLTNESSNLQSSNRSHWIWV
jgi:hypothetical protein